MSRANPLWDTGWATRKVWHCLQCFDNDNSADVRTNAGDWFLLDFVSISILENSLGDTDIIDTYLGRHFWLGWCFFYPKSWVSVALCLMTSCNSLARHYTLKTTNVGEFLWYGGFVQGTCVGRVLGQYLQPFIASIGCVVIHLSMGKLRLDREPMVLCKHS